MSEFLDFKAISAAIPFKSVLDHFNIPYDETDKELRTEEIVVSKEKNLFFSLKGNGKGSVINFFANHEGIDLRRAAAALKRLFLDKPQEKKLPEYELTYHPYFKSVGITEETAKHFEAGYCGRGIMSGKIAYKILDADGNKVAYCGEHPQENKWFFPKGYQHTHIYNLYRVKSEYVILAVSPAAVMRIHQLGFNKVVGLLSANMTKEQEDLLCSRFKSILLLHPQPENIASRLVKRIFIKAPGFDKAIGELTAEDLD